MTVVQLKEKIIAKITATDDEELLEHIYNFIDFKYDTIHQMSSGEIDAVNEALEQFKNGEVISHEEANRQINE